MKNITVSLDDRLYHLVRIRAAERHSTVTALVRSYLIRLVGEDSHFDQLRRQQNEAISDIRAEHPGFSAGSRLSREQVHDRDALR
jgi:hypothetical protein